MTDEKKLTWFELMWKNFYIQLFAIAVVALLGVLYVQFFSEEGFYELSGFLIGLGIPIGMIIMISYFAFYKYWKEYSQTIKK